MHWKEDFRYELLKEQKHTEVSIFGKLFLTLNLTTLLHMIHVP